MPVVKVQRPLFTQDHNFPYLVYAEGYVGLQRIPERDVPPHVVTELKHNPKAYFEADLIDGVWNIGKKAKPQDW